MLTDLRSGCLAPAKTDFQAITTAASDRPFRSSAASNFGKKDFKPLMRFHHSTLFNRGRPACLGIARG
jgi:hypothetical protein